MILKKSDFKANGIMLQSVLTKRCLETMFRAIIFFLLVCLTPNWSIAQNSFMKRDLSKVDVDNLSDREIKTILVEFEKSGLTESELEKLALANDMPKTQVDKLRKRIYKIQNDTISQKDNNRKYIFPDTLEDTGFVRKVDFQKPSELTKIYGSSLFNNQNLTFEPSLSMSPPSDYILGSGDELIIDIWGASRNYLEQTVDRSGAIRLENVGPIQVAGLTVQQAESKIKNRLSQIYSGLSGSSPNTYAQITLGRLKKIKVTMIGEVRSPGTYTLPSLATAFNALYLSGGPSMLGSFRQVEVIRNHKIIAELDVYDFLLEGRSEGNIQLMDQDLIRVPTYQKRLEFVGEVKRPGIYEAEGEESLSDLIKHAGGFTKQAYKDRIHVQRYSSKEKKVLDVHHNQMDTFKLKNGDKVSVGKIIDRFKNRVTISGAIFRPGEYELTSNLTLKELITKADGLRPSAFKERAEIIRELEDQSLKVISFDLAKLMAGEIGDIKLEREDVVNITSINDLEEEYEIEIKGDVQKPGSYPYYKNMSLQALILKAGGFAESASVDRVEVARRVTGDNQKDNSEIAKLFQFEVSENLSIKDVEFTLNPFDQVYVRRAPNYQVQKTVYVQGSIKFPGSYVLEKKNSRISDLVERAGGLNEFAYPEGAKLVRNYQAKTENIGIDLPAILAKPNSREDLFLLPGDKLVIPKELQTVRINGEVFFPVSTRYQGSKGLKSYVNSAGGFRNKAIKRKTLVRYANGYVKNTTSFLGLKFYPKVEPGAEIIVPTKPERREISTQEVIGWTSGIATLGLIIVNIIQAGN